MKPFNKFSIKPKQFLFFYVLLISSLYMLSVDKNIAYSQDATTSSTTAEAAKNGPRKEQVTGLIYNIEADNPAKKILVVGSAHFGYSKLNQVNELLKKHMDSFCRKFADESTLDESMSNEELLRLPPMPTGENYFSDALANEIYLLTFKKFGSVLNLFNADSPAKIKKLPLLVVVMTVISSIDVDGMPQTTGVSIDQTFQEFANLRGEKIEALEKRLATQAHYRSIDSTDYVLMIKELIKLSKDTEKQKVLGHHGTESLDNNLLGDPDVVRSKLIDSFALSTNIKPELWERFFFNRDKHITEEIEKYLLSGKNYCIALGAAHLGGEAGVLRRLAAKGYKITQLKD
jgi:TraB/PrgY/gumN family